MTTIASRTTPSLVRTVALLAIGAVVAVVANEIVALAASASGATPGWAPLQLPVFGAFTVLGLVAGWVGWRTVMRRTARPAAVLRILVPVVAVLSFVPDVVLALTGFIPGTTTVGVVALSIMHVVVLGVALPLYTRIAIER